MEGWTLRSKPKKQKEMLSFDRTLDINGIEIIPTVDQNYNIFERYWNNHDCS